jgi:hypothetical protein
MMEIENIPKQLTLEDMKASRPKWTLKELNPWFMNLEGIQV